jgi:hypothetical protein
MKPLHYNQILEKESKKIEILIILIKFCRYYKYTYASTLIIM